MTLFTFPKENRGKASESDIAKGGKDMRTLEKGKEK